MIKLTVPPSTVLDVAVGTTAVDALSQADKKEARKAVAAKVDGDVVDLSAPIEADATGTGLGRMFLSAVGDVDGDGTMDVYASDWDNRAKGQSTGRIYVHSGKTGENLSEKIMGYAVLGGKAAKRFNTYASKKARKKTWKKGTWIRGIVYAKGSGRYPASVIVDYVGKVK